MSDITNIEGTRIHGEVMYALALMYAVEVIKIDPSNALAILEAKLADSEAVKGHYSELLKKVEK